MPANSAPGHSSFQKECTLNQAHAPNRLLGLPWWLAYERFIGVDIHKHYVTVVALDQQRQVLFHRRRIPLEQWPAWVEQHLTPQDAVIMEATTNCWWVYDQTAPVAGRCVVAHPDSKARVKTAPRGPPQDAKRWAERLLADDFKPVWAPPQAVRELHSLLAYRQRQVTAPECPVGEAQESSAGAAPSHQIVPSPEAHASASPVQRVVGRRAKGLHSTIAAPFLSIRCLALSASPAQRPFGKLCYYSEASQRLGYAHLRSPLCLRH